MDPAFRLAASRILVLVGVLCAPAPVVAQHADINQIGRFDIAVGFTMNQPADVNQRPKCTELGLPCGTPRTFPDFGIDGQAVVHVTPHLAVVAEGSFYNNSWVAAGEDVTRANHVSAILAGPHVTTRERTLAFGTDTTRYRAFGQVLVGPEASTVLPTRFAVQPGAGVDFKLSPARLWFRIAYDYRATRGSPRNLSGSRVLGALVLARGGPP